MRNKIEGVNRSRGEAGETVHHLYIALLKKYVSQSTFQQYRDRYQECVRMLNGLERTLERNLPVSDRRWHVAEDHTSRTAQKVSCARLAGLLKPET